MKRVNIFPFYQVAYRLHPLGGIEEGVKIKDWQSRLFSAQMWLDWILDSSAVPLGVSRSPAQELRSAVNTVLEPPQAQPSLYGVPQIGSLATSEDRELSWLEAYNIRDGVRKFETVLAADLESLSIYFVSPKLGYDTRILIEDAGKLLPSGLDAVPASTAQEYLDVGKCIAFDIPTAAGFHIIRATESVIRKYYEIIVGTPPKPKLRNWGVYIRNLEKAGADKKITGFLDHIREQYRNPVLHPEVNLTSDEAQILLGVCTSAIVMIAAAISKLEAARALETTSENMGSK